MSTNKALAAKISAAVGSLAALTPMAADADIVHKDEEISFDFNRSVDEVVEWDVDGRHGYDFYLQRDGALLDLNSDGGNGRGFVNAGAPSGSHSTFIKNLSNGFAVGPTLAPGYNWGRYGFNQRSVLTSRLIELGDTGTTQYGAVQGFTPGVFGFAGFAFDADGTTLYGWARITFDLTSPGTVTIHEWAYEDNGGAIRVGAVPEPHSLALLAMGAAGLAAWRTRRGKAV